MTATGQETDRTQRDVRSVLGIAVDVLSWTNATERILNWAAAGESRTVCLCNVHSLVTARNDSAHQAALASADMVAPDGAPIAWMLRKLGVRTQERISGPDLMWRCCAEAARRNAGIYLYGGTEATIVSLVNALRTSFDGLKIVGWHSPPFRELSAGEDEAVIQQINASGASLVWVGLGCPKQEAFMHTHKSRIRAVMVGVGAAFDFHSGAVKRAPLWMRNSGLEWLHRLAQDPRRLARRYILSNVIFLCSAAADVLSYRNRAARGVRQEPAR